jgi:hypothetical protein
MADTGPLERAEIARAVAFIIEDFRSRMAQIEQTQRAHGHEIAEWESARQAVREHLKIADALNDESRTWVAVRGQDVERIDGELQRHLGSHKLRWDTQQQANAETTKARWTFKQAVIVAAIGAAGLIGVALIQALLK